MEVIGREVEALNIKASRYRHRKVKDFINREGKCGPDRIFDNRSKNILGKVSGELQMDLRWAETYI